MNSLQIFLISFLLYIFLQILQLLHQFYAPEWVYFLSILFSSLQNCITIFVCLFFITKVSLQFSALKWDKVKFSAVVSLLILFIFEVSIQLCWHSPNRIPKFLISDFRSAYDQCQRNIIQFDPNISKYDHRYFYSLIPNTSSVFSNYEFNTNIISNGNGFRNISSLSNSPRIICLGDSYTFGWGVSDNQSYPARLAKLTSINVANVSMPSFGTAREILALEVMSLDSLDVLIVQYCRNDSIENNEYLGKGGKLDISDSSKYNQACASLTRSRCYFPGRNIGIISGRFFRTLFEKFRNSIYSDTPKSIMNVGSQEKEVENVFSIIKRAPVDFKKVKVIITWLGPKNEFSDELTHVFQREVKNPNQSSFFKAGIRFVDLSKQLTEMDYFILDPHLNIGGQEKVAEALRDCLRNF